MSEELTAREKITKYCEIKKEAGRRGDVLVFGRRSYRMNRLVGGLTDVECEKVVKMSELDAYIAKYAAKGNRPLTGAAAKSVRKDRVVVGPKPCECGCGEEARAGRKFRPGHDMKLKGALRAAAADGGALAGAKAEAELKARGWA